MAAPALDRPQPVALVQSIGLHQSALRDARKHRGNPYCRRSPAGYARLVVEEPWWEPWRWAAKIRAGCEAQVWCSVYGALCIWNGARMPMVTYPGSGWVLCDEAAEAMSGWRACLPTGLMRSATPCRRPPSPVCRKYRKLRMSLREISAAPWETAGNGPGWMPAFRN